MELLCNISIYQYTTGLNYSNSLQQTEGTVTIFYKGINVSGLFESNASEPHRNIPNMEDNTEDSLKGTSALANQIAHFCTGNDLYT